MAPASSPETPLRLKDIKQVDARTLGVEWLDGKRQVFDVVQLRRSCPCAECVDELTGKRTLRPDQVGEDVRPLSLVSVGRYAINIVFSDGHRTGYYTFDYLRNL